MHQKNPKQTTGKKFQNCENCIVVHIPPPPPFAVPDRQQNRKFIEPSIRCSWAEFGLMNRVVFAKVALPFLRESLSMLCFVQNTAPCILFASFKVYRIGKGDTMTERDTFHCVSSQQRAISGNAFVPFFFSPCKNF